MKNIKIVLILVLVLSLTLLVGCRINPSPAPAPEQPENQNMQPTERDTPTDPDMSPRNIENPDQQRLPDQGQTRPNDGMMTEENIAEDIANSVSNMAGVERADVVVVGNMALIGIRTEVDDSDDIKNKVTSEVEGQHENIEQAIVTADPDLTERIGRVADQQRGGEPTSQLLEEINNIIREVRPDADTAQ
ncbi:YhcN/YlaJ family sporulation lipoprotein [Proteinivorax hydrogeniformans]|uniref:YhcN/YlaJ family sporulation lipoprotein n=1 Tax=Proteinivorax hydrogeniformans TaxID=1826727 RepID=A0AAU8HWV5_9FIRM